MNEISYSVLGFFLQWKDSSPFHIQGVDAVFLFFYNMVFEGDGKFKKQSSCTVGIGEAGRIANDKSSW